MRFRQQKANAGPFTRPDGTWGDWSLRTTPTTTALMSSSARTPRSILWRRQRGCSCLRRFAGARHVLPSYETI